jgi:hypothetical protein
VAYVPIPHAAQTTPAPGAPNVPATQEQLATDVAAGGDTELAGHAEDAFPPVQKKLAGHGLQSAVVAFTSPHVPAGHAQSRALEDPTGDTDGAGHATGDPDGQKKLGGHMVHRATYSA